jgi:hypothetical protein
VVLDVAVPSVVYLPACFKKEFARILTTVVQLLGPRDCQLPITALGALLLHAPQSAVSLVGELMSRVRAFDRGDFGALIESAKKRAARTARGNPRTVVERSSLSKRICEVVRRSGPCRKAAVMLAPQADMATGQRAMDVARLLHPTGPLPGEAGAALVAPVQVSNDDVLKAIRSFPKESAPGRGGTRPEHLRAACEAWGGVGAQAADALTHVVNAILSGEVADILNQGELLLISKGEGRGWRPIVLLPVLRRLASKCALAASRDIIAPFMVEARQFGVGRPGGVEVVASTVGSIVDEGGVVRSIDLENAFNSIRRDTAYDAVKDAFPRLAPYAFATYSRPLRLHLRGAPGCTVDATRGGPQGDPFSPFAFAVALARARARVAERADEAGFQFVDWWYVDDGCVVVEEEHAGTFEELLREEGGAIGCALKFVTRAPRDHLRVPLGDNRRSERVRQCADAIRDLRRTVTDDPHTAFALLRTCLAPAVRLRLLARCRRDVDWEDVDDQLRGAMEDILGGADGLEDDGTWAQCQLPVAEGGCGLQSMQDHASAFFGEAAGVRAGDAEALAAARALLRLPEQHAADTAAPVDNVGIVANALRRRWMASAEARGARDTVHAQDVAHEWTGDFLVHHPKAVGMEGYMRPEAFRRALRNRLGMRHVVASGSHAAENPDEEVHGAVAPPCTRCRQGMEPDCRHAIGCVGSRGTRHNAVRDVIAKFAREAGRECRVEQTLERLQQWATRGGAEVCGAPSHESPVIDDESRDGAASSGDDPQARPRAARTRLGSSERPIDVLILHRPVGASSAAALDVTIALPDSRAGVAGLRARGGPDWRRALTLARRRKEQLRAEIMKRGASFDPIVFSTNGRVDDGSVGALEKIASEWGLAHGCPKGEALTVLRGRISNAIHGWNGECLLSLCRRAVEARREDHRRQPSGGALTYREDSDQSPSEDWDFEGTGVQSDGSENPERLVMPIAADHPTGSMGSNVSEPSRLSDPEARNPCERPFGGVFGADENEGQQGVVTHL